MGGTRRRVRGLGIDVPRDPVRDRHDPRLSVHGDPLSDRRRAALRVGRTAWRRDRRPSRPPPVGGRGARRRPAVRRRQLARRLVGDAGRHGHRCAADRSRAALDGLVRPRGERSASVAHGPARAARRLRRCRAPGVAVGPEPHRCARRGGVARLRRCLGGGIARRAARVAAPAAARVIGHADVRRRNAADAGGGRVRRADRGRARVAEVGARDGLSDRLRLLACVLGVHVAAPGGADERRVDLRVRESGRRRGSGLGRAQRAALGAHAGGRA